MGGSIRSMVSALLELDPDTRYALCYRFSRWRRGHLFRPDAPNATLRVIQDPLNRFLLPDVRLFHSMGIFLPYTPRGRGLTRLVTVHDLNAVRNTEWVRPGWHARRSAKIRDVIERADHLVTYSAFTAREVCEEYGLPPDRVHPVLLGVDRSRYRPPSDERIAEMRRRYGDYVISIGLLTARKNFPLLIRAMRKLGGVKLLLVGRDTDGTAAVEQAIEETGLRDSVVRLRGLAHESLVELVAAARVCAVPSLYEGFGLTALEAMACGTPVVCSDAASLPEVVGDAALLVDARSVDAVASALERVLGDSELGSDLRRRGLARAEAMSWRASARALRDLYASVT